MSHGEKRSGNRPAVHWSAHARGEGTSLVGAAVCDVSDAGIFMRIPTSDRLPEVGSSLAITVFTHGLGQGIQAKATVRWAGHSKRHNCKGLGLMFDKPDVGPQLLALAA